MRTPSHGKAELESDRDTGRTYQTVANIGLAVGIVGIGTSAVLLLLTEGQSAPPQTARARRRSTWSSARIGVGAGYVDLSGSF